MVTISFFFFLLYQSSEVVWLQVDEKAGDEIIYNDGGSLWHIAPQKGEIII